jgi:uncharacterized protein YraI
MLTTIKLSILATGLALLASPAFAVSANTIADASLSAGPGADYGAAKPLAIGTRVDVIWCGAHGNWCLVDLHNKKGWIPLADLKLGGSKATLVDGGTTDHGGPQVASSGSGGGGQKVLSMATQTAPHQTIHIPPGWKLNP